MALPFDPMQVESIEYSASIPKTVQLTMKNGKIQTIQGPEFTDEVGAFIGWITDEHPGSAKRKT
jgi:hypothetical protein